MKLTRYSAGEYGWQNGVTVRKIEKKWYVFWVSGKVAFIGSTLNACKWFLYYEYPNHFRF